MSAFLLTALLLGQLALLLDLGGRLFGTYARTPLRAALRITIVVAACCALAAPAIYSLAFQYDRTSCGLWLSGIGSMLVLFHFLFPFRFGIRRTSGSSPTETAQLIPGIRLRTETFTSSLVPASAHGFECLVLSDFHCNTERKLSLLQEIVAALKNETPDCVFVLGDLGENNPLLPDIIATLAELPDRHGKFLVRSNHDFEGGREEIVRRLAQEHAIRVLANEAVVLPESGVSLVGVEYPWNERGEPSVQDDTFSVGLTHTPDNLTHIARLNVPVSVAGHTHGGKLRLPLIGALLVPCKIGRLLDWGWFEKGGSRLFVTKGIGYFPGCLGSEGEVVRLRFERHEQTW
jgi:uncharacterized protein